MIPEQPSQLQQAPSIKKLEFLEYLEAPHGKKLEFLEQYFKESTGLASDAKLDFVILRADGSVWCKQAPEKLLTTFDELYSRTEWMAACRKTSKYHQEVLDKFEKKEDDQNEFLPVPATTFIEQKSSLNFSLGFQKQAED